MLYCIIGGCSVNSHNNIGVKVFGPEQTNADLTLSSTSRLKYRCSLKGNSLIFRRGRCIHSYVLGSVRKVMIVFQIYPRTE